MRWGVVMRVAAVAAFAGFWWAWAELYIPVDPADLPSIPEWIFYGVWVGLPALLVGMALGRWWAPAVGLVFVALLAAPERCVLDSRGSDFVLYGCGGIPTELLPTLLGVTTGGALAGAAVMKPFVRRRAAPATA